MSEADVQVSIPSPTFTPRLRKAELVPIDQSKNVVLPEIRSSINIDKSKPLPTSLQSDFLPEDILLALTHPPPVKDKLGPVTLTRSLNTSNAQTRPAPANVWNHKRRDRFKHLVENTPCLCGAGKDISFLYDVPQKLSHHPEPEQVTTGQNKETITLPGKPLQLPDTLVPEEYHIVRNKGIVGKQYHEDKYSTNPEDHEKHLVVFPSLKPASRYEVLQLKKSLNNMLDKIGANELDAGLEAGPTQMHNLLELIKQEQNIYNIVFHELIRQTSVECVERGELLAELRKKYSDLINRIPQQVMSLHEEVMAQRALDRRLTEELLRFKGTISYLTSELTDVKEHDLKVTKEALKAQEDLCNALMDSQKNANLLSEYHELYELQRQRLENQVFALTEEKEIWSTAAYSLALKVTEENQLNTAKRLHLSEKGWVKLANHFTILLTVKDTDQLTQIQGHVEAWRDEIEDFNLALKEREDELRENLKLLKAAVQSYWINFQTKFVDLDNGVVKKPSDEFVKSLIGALHGWEEAIANETAHFEGDNLLNKQDQLSHIRHEVEGWTDCALRVFRWHRGIDRKTHQHQESMQILNEEVDQLLAQFQHRITGENGVAALIIQVQSSMDAWTTKLFSYSHGVLVLQDSDWANLYQTMEDWVVQLTQAVDYVGTTQKEEERQEEKPHKSFKKPKGFKIVLDLHDVMRKTQKWATTASNSIDSEDAKMVDQVSSLHSEIVKWMVQVLLRLAPDKEGNSKESNEMALMGSAPMPKLIEVAKKIFESLERFSNNLTLCCHSIVMENTQKRKELKEDNADHELKDLQRLKTECDDWIHTAQMLLSELTGEPIGVMFPVRDPGTFMTEPAEQQTDQSADQPADQELKVVSEVKDKDSEMPTLDTEKSDLSLRENTNLPEHSVEKVPSGIELFVEQDTALKPVEESLEMQQSPPSKTPPDQTSAKPATLGERIQVLGHDANTHKFTIIDDVAQSHGHSDTVPRVEGSPDTKGAFEALASLERLQTELIATEERAQNAEQRASQAEADIVALQEKVRNLEKLLGQQENNHLQIESSKASSQLPSSAEVKTSATTPTSHTGKEEKAKKSGKASSKGSKKK
ncbi:axonemal dynein light chain domain-containing protein 1-like isoform X1 [Biomphalaria glabrata]|uniref:Axonemal dynein light chain domain-containing protein 1-like isoform X1 n=1 Tax=Biomphalaria glabrata TaxID=6526 RepID=A0A9W3BBN6_BIOGL|nr:axonemal dynein light chain domain-containing protein 1-like isoform X1 [Biomphalaria glabrata]XP_055896859.1 axonemal dynein light chain domain-containing protein 1-like isoform X1 [Biomphalaria glabrata]XP_055896860.1 axonemal dynein light chain domain-containing protein 1-like isoform X1 [Biomphalaria glabrata]XP_055896861.1 axonemal dynein light chain domain-containing protein 1-like isoform X1 [Biomphalaria glabrata]XP_055896862.1 axonemal dynein light chain domain-containing protein 1-